jgi:hypothetical protein
MSFFSKFFGFLAKAEKNPIGQVAEGMAVQRVGQLFENALEATKVKDPALADSVVKTFKAWTPYLADAAAKTTPEFDDKLVQELVDELNEFSGESSATTE